MKLYQINICDIDSAQFNVWFNQMDNERKNIILQTKTEHKRNLRIAADALCRKAISDFCGISPAEIVFKYTQTGKPYIKGLPVHFSISHSGDMAVCVVSDNEIGIDIEKIRDINPRICERFATKEETEYIRNFKNGLFEIWTLKEAYFKCIGTGLNKDIKNVSFDICENNIICSEKGYRLSFYETNPDYICSVCEKH